MSRNSFIRHGSSTNQTFAGALSGDFSLAKTGSNTLSLTGANTQTGPTYIVTGTLASSTSSNVLSPNSTIDIASGATLSNTTANTVPQITGLGTITNTNTLTVGDSGTFTWAGNWSSGGIVKAGSGTAIFTGANTSTSAKSITAGTLQLGDGGTSGSFVSSGTVTVSSGATLAFNRSDDVSIGFVIAGAGGVTQIGTGKVTLTANTSSNTGVLTITNGTVEFTTTPTVITFSSIVNNSALIFNATTARSYANVISGSGTLRISNVGVVTLTGTNTYSGVTTIDVGSQLTLGSGSSGTLGSGTVANDGTLAFTRTTGNTYNVSNVISGTGVVKMLSMSGTVILSADNSYSGGTQYGTGTGGLQIGNGGTTGTIGSGDLTPYAGGSTHVLRWNRSDAYTFANNMTLGINTAVAIQITGTGSTIFTGTITNGVTTSTIAVNGGGGIGGTSNFTPTGFGTTTISNSSYIFGGTGTGNAGTLTIKALTFSGAGNRVKVYSDGSFLSKVECGSSTITAASGVTVDLMDVMPTGTYTLLATTGTKPTTAITIGTNNSTRTPTLSWVVGVGLQLVLV